jgi:hypothetical protein
MVRFFNQNVMIRKIFNWIFKAELSRLNSEIKTAKYLVEKLEKQQKAFNVVLSNIDVSVDVHEYDHRYSPSWAVISLQGQKTDYIKFVELGQSEMNEIARFLRNFERNSNIKVDASPMASQFLRVPRSKRF